MGNKERRHRQLKRLVPVPGAGSHPASTPGEPLWDWFRRCLSKPVSGTSLAVLRIALGLIMCLEAYSLCRPSAITMRSTPLETYFTGQDVRFNFPYHGFEWLPLFSPTWIHVLVGIQVAAGLMVAVGFCYRASAAVLFLTWGYFFAAESTRTYWQSHYYIELLITFLMVWMPAARRYSVDAVLHPRTTLASTVPFWPILLLRAQLVLMYFYGGISKLNADWLADAAPLRWDLAEAHVAAPLRHFLSVAQFDWVRGILQSTAFAYFLSYAGAIFDLAIGPMLIIRRTRILGLALMMIFHATNSAIIYDNIDWFPLVGAASALIFLDPDWPERLGRWLLQPRVREPDWGWFAAGGLLLPPVGVLLGWRLPASQSTPGIQYARVPLARWTAPLVIAWLTFQAMIPIRHYLIPGDGRFTHEGLSFSWRLKADKYHAIAAQISIDDPGLISRAGSARARINWKDWNGEKVLYRRVPAGQINWAKLPEIVVLLEPITGERILYNPIAGKASTEAAAYERVKTFWNEIYGRAPQAIRRTVLLSQTLDVISQARRQEGDASDAARFAGLASAAREWERGAPDPQAGVQNLATIRTVLGDLRTGAGGQSLLRVLRGLKPYALEGERVGSAPFLMIEDAALDDVVHRTINRNAWKSGPQTSDAALALDLHEGGQPLVIYLHDIGADEADMLPQASIFDVQDRPQDLPFIHWNAARDLTRSKFMHISTQPFYLRRYARRIAALWAQSYQRRPMIHATTAVSFNHRPHQPIVDPETDLAAVKLAWFGRNQWIKDLECPRIPPEELHRAPAASE